jgi:hypothetical protein
MTHEKILNIELNPNGVAAPAQRTVIIASQVVATCLKAFENDESFTTDLKSGFVAYQFNGIEMDDTEKRETYQNWILSKGFQDLAKGVRETLEEAVFYLAMIERKPGLTTLAKVNADIAAVRKRAGAMPFPDLLSKVNVGLTEPMAFEDEFASIQKVRNCLEHRGGRVTEREVNADTDVLSLRFPRLRMFYMRGDQEIELAVGEVIDTKSPDNPFGEGKDVPIYLNRVTRSREYGLGEAVKISSADFVEIAMACNLFASDLASKLPTLPPAHDAG